MFDEESPGFLPAWRQNQRTGLLFISHVTVSHLMIVYPTWSSARALLWEGTGVTLGLLPEPEPAWTLIFLKHGGQRTSCYVWLSEERDTAPPTPTPTQTVCLQQHPTETHADQHGPEERAESRWVTLTEPAEGCRFWGDNCWFSRESVRLSARCWPPCFSLSTNVSVGNRLINNR